MDVSHVVHSIKLAWGSAIATVGVGLGTIMDFIPDDIGKLASVFGIILTMVLIVNHWKMGLLNRKNIRLKNEKLISELKE